MQMPQCVVEKVQGKVGGFRARVLVPAFVHEIEVVGANTMLKARSAENMGFTVGAGSGENIGFEIASLNIKIRLDKPRSDKSMFLGKKLSPSFLFEHF